MNISKEDLEWLNGHPCLEERLLCTICEGDTASTTLEHDEYPLHSAGKVYCCDKECSGHTYKEVQVDTKFLPAHLKPNPKYQKILDKYVTTISTETSDKASIYKDLASVTTELSSIHTSLSKLLPRQKELEDKFQVLLKLLNPTRDISNDDPLL